MFHWLAKMGRNEVHLILISGAQLKMVPPVLTRVTSSKNRSFESTFTVSMCIEAEEDKSLPEPLNPLVYIEHFPAMNVFVKSVDGLTNDEKWLWEARRLAEILQHKEHIRTDVYFTAAYENPLQLMCQENEVWLVKYESEANIVPLKKHNTVNVGDQRITMPSFAVRILSFMISCFTLFYAGVSACLNFGSFARSNVHLLHKTFRSTVECLASKNYVLNFVYLTCLSSLNKGLGVIHWVNKTVNYR